MVAPALNHRPTPTARAPAEKEVDWVYRHMGDLDKKEFRQRLVVEREDHFQLFLAIAIVLLILEMLIGEVKSGKPITV